MNVVSSKNIVHIIRRALNCVDPRLIGHGERVAFLLYEMLRVQGGHSEQELGDLTLLGLLHDIGAYKTEDIDRMVEFESQNIWEHSVYGYLFLKNLSPLSSYADVILYHHLPYYQYSLASGTLTRGHYGGLVHLADRADLLLENRDEAFCEQYLQKHRGHLFAPEWVDLFLQTNAQRSIAKRIYDGSYFQEFERVAQSVSFSRKEKLEFLTMIAYSIDFRSEFMVLHTVTTVSVSRVLASLMGMNGEEREKIYYAALLHDVGKVSTPVAILEKPGRLTTEEMAVMQRHVVDTGHILGDYLDSDVKRIAVRHHEKLDGSGYPLGLTGGQLSKSDRIVAVADILSALIRKRSYKDAFDKETTLSILTHMRDEKKICPQVTEIVLQNYDEILETAEAFGREVVEMYQGLQLDYRRILSALPPTLREQDPALSFRG